MGDDNGFAEYKRLIMANFDRHEAALHELEEKHAKERGELRKELASLNEKLVILTTQFRARSGVWGLLGGAIPAIAAILFWILTTKT